MSLAMRKKIFITAALTGSGSTQDRSDKVPRSPAQIAEAAIDAARAGAAVVHCHVRDPETGKPARDVHLYREVVERIRLVLELALRVPGVASLHAAAYVRDRVDEAAIDEAQSRGAERCRHGNAV